MGPAQAKQCQLRTFLTYYINDLFLSQVRTETNKEIEAVTKVSDPLKILASADTMKNLGVQRPLLQVSFLFVCLFANDPKRSFFRHFSVNV